jgi:putative SOS response-associated peptidase YedK
MPVILPISHEHRWLADTHGVYFNQPLAPYPADEVRCYPVSGKVNKAPFNEPDAILPLEPVIH